MDAKTRAEKGIGYYYKNDDGSIVYIPIDRGKTVVEKWLKDNNREWYKVELWDALTIRTNISEG
jgi:hypothetical protein